MSEATPKHRFRNQFNSYGVARQQTAKMKKLRRRLRLRLPLALRLAVTMSRKSATKQKGDKSKPNAIFLRLAGQTKRPPLRATRPRTG